MDEISNKQLDALRSAAVKLLEITEQIQGSNVTPPKATAERVERRLSERRCLACGEPIPDGEQVVRGCDRTCSALIYKRIREGKYTTAQAILMGWFTKELGKPGVPAKFDVSMAAETPENYVADSDRTDPEADEE